MISEYIEHIRTNRGYSRATVINYERDARAFVTFMKKHRPSAKWSQIQPADVDAYVQALVNEKFTAATIKRRVSVIRGIFNYMRYKGMTDQNPARFTTTPKAGRSLPKTIETDAIRAAIEDRTTTLTTRVQIAIIAETGIRIAELQAMNIEDIDRQQRTIHIHGKGAKEREVNFGQRTAELFEEYIGQGTGRMFTADTREIEYNIHKALRKHSSRPQCSPHAIRHTFASEMTRSGAQLQAIAKMLGHESTKTTERYSHMMTATQAENYRRYAPRY